MKRVAVPNKNIQTSNAERFHCLQVVSRFGVEPVSVLRALERVVALLSDVEPVVVVAGVLYDVSKEK